MTKKDLFILLIKLFGLNSLILNVFSYIPNQIQIMIHSQDLIALWFGLSSIALSGFLFSVLILKADKIVSLLRLEHKFDNDRIVLGELWANDVIKISCFIMGGFLVIQNIPDFLSHTLFTFKIEIGGVKTLNDDYFGWFKTGINLIVGVLLLINFKFIAKVFNTQSGSDSTN